MSARRVAVLVVLLIHRVNNYLGHLARTELVLIVRGQGARLVDSETLADTATSKPRKLLKNNGSIVTGIARSVRPPGRPNPAPNATFDGGARARASTTTASRISSTTCAIG